MKKETRCFTRCYLYIYLPIYWQRWKQNTDLLVFWGPGKITIPIYCWKIKWQHISEDLKTAISDLVISLLQMILRKVASQYVNIYTATFNGRKNWKYHIYSEIEDSPNKLHSLIESVKSNRNDCAFIIIKEQTIQSTAKWKKKKKNLPQKTKAWSTYLCSRTHSLLINVFRSAAPPWTAKGGWGPTPALILS